jgi:hypothetical protein
MTMQRTAGVRTGRFGPTKARRLALAAATLAAVAGIGPAAPTHAATERAATVIVGGDPVSLPAVHPCTGEFVVVDFFDLHVVLRAATDRAGAFHELRNIRGRFAIGDLTGQFHETYVVNDFGPIGPGDSITANVQVYVGAAGDGSRMVAHVNVHVRLRDGAPIAEINDFRAQCIGFA